MRPKRPFMIFLLLLFSLSLWIDFCGRQLSKWLLLAVQAH